jgi:quaternary ammonium compound-resistance protein SugE
MSWIILFFAGLFEVGWAVGLKHTDGFTRFWPSVGTIASMIVSLGLLGLALKSLPLGTAYAIWVGVGVIGTVAVGVAFLGEPAGLVKIVSVLLILAGVVGLKLAA